MDLSPEEQSFFDAGNAIEDSSPAANEPHRHRSRRRSRRRSVTRKLRRTLRRSSWGKIVLSVILMTAAVGAGYWASMFVANRDVPTPAELGVEARGR